MTTVAAPAAGASGGISAWPGLRRAPWLAIGLVFAGLCAAGCHGPAARTGADAPQATGEPASEARDGAKPAAGTATTPFAGGVAAANPLAVNAGLEVLEAGG